MRMSDPVGAGGAGEAGCKMRASLGEPARMAVQALMVCGRVAILDSLPSGCHLGEIKTRPMTCRRRRVGLAPVQGGFKMETLNRALIG